MEVSVYATSSTVRDWSVTITGLLYGLTLPPALPLWMVACGGIIGVAMAKFLFGGLGYNAFNPALVGRAFLQAANCPRLQGYLFGPAVPAEMMEFLLRTGRTAPRNAGSRGHAGGHAPGGSRQPLRQADM